MSDPSPNEQLYETCFEALVKASGVISEIELSALCHMAGIPYKDVLEAAEADMEPHKRTGYAEKMADYADNERKRQREVG